MRDAIRKDKKFENNDQLVNGCESLKVICARALFYVCNSEIHSPPPPPGFSSPSFPAPPPPPRHCHRFRLLINLPPPPPPPLLLLLLFFFLLNIQKFSSLSPFSPRVSSPFKMRKYDDIFIQVRNEEK